MEITLVTMPWQALETPSLALGILRSVVTAELPDVGVSEYYGNLAWAELLMAEFDPARVAGAYKEVGEDGIFDGLGDWIFAEALYGTPPTAAADYRRYASDRQLDLTESEQWRQRASRFVDTVADQIVARSPAVVGFTTTFMQNLASLAVAARIKSLRPATTIVFGGANCEGPMGHALHRNHTFVDFVVRGEGERALPALLRAIRDGGSPRRIPGLCWWDRGVSIANPEARQVLPPGLIPQPDYTAWQDRFDGSPVREYVTPELVIEGSRGCWWGEKHHCTFCGLNGSSIEFRNKTPQRFLEELSNLVKRHRVLDILPVDNIMSMDYVRELLPALADMDWDLRVHYELKANLRSDQIALLSAAGIVQVQFGIESLSSPVLALMDKGVRGSTNVRVLRDCEQHSVTVVWNYLYGFPGETDEHYEAVIDQFPALVHLQAPLGASRVVIERFSPFFEQPRLGFTEGRSPAAFYPLVYDLPAAELEDLAYFFDAPPAGIANDLAAALDEGIARWQEAYPRSELLATQTADSLVIQDRRVGWPCRDHAFSGWRRHAYLALARARTQSRLTTILGEAGWNVDGDHLRGFLADLVADGLIFVDGDSSIALATSSTPVKTGTHERRH